jgi:DNA-binding LacI/PurR family transcriptional regulator
MADSDPVTLRRLAAECGMSPSAVSKILRKAYKGNTPKGRRRVEEVTSLARKLGYMASGPARRLRSGRTHAIAILTPVDSFGHPEHASFEFINGGAGALAAAGYGLSLLNISREDEGAALNALTDRSVDGVIVLEQSSPALERFLAQASLPAVYLNVEPKPGLPTITRDEYASARSVMEITIGLGYRRFIIAGGPAGAAAHFSHRQRAAAIADVGAANPSVTLLYNGEPSWYASFERSIAALAPDADTLVMAVDAAAALRLPYSLPPNQPMACCDDTHQFASLAPWMTRACFDRSDMGRRAADLLLRHLGDPSSPLVPLVIEGRVLVGKSTPTRSAGVGR